MAEDVLLKDFPKADFEARMAAELTKFLTDNADYFAANPDERNELMSTSAATIDDMYHVLHNEQLANRVTRDEGTTIVWLGPDLDPVRTIMTRSDTASVNAACIAAIVPVAVDALAIVFQAIGTGVIARQVATRLISGLGPTEIIGLQATVNAIEGAATTFAKAISIAKLGGAILRLIGLKQIVQALKENLRWYHWVIMGVIIVAQIVAWFASDGIALAAEIVILGGLVASLVVDVKHAISVCGGSAPAAAVPATA